MTTQGRNGVVLGASERNSGWHQEYYQLTSHSPGLSSKLPKEHDWNEKKPQLDTEKSFVLIFMFPYLEFGRDNWIFAKETPFKFSHCSMLFELIELK